MQKTDKLTISMAITLVLATLFVCLADFAADCAAVREDSLRLHIIANSDSEQDQALKLLVRDSILAQYGGLLAQCESREQAQRLADFLQEDMLRTAQKTLLEQGCEQACSLQLTEMFFDTRRYADDTMPAGRYLALRFVLGEGKGQNWWCVMYPPLCIPAARGEKALQIEQNIHNLSHSPAFVAKFKVVEVLEKLKAKVDKAQ